MEHLTQNQALHLGADLIEEIIVSENETIVYTGVFARKTDENTIIDPNDPNEKRGCIIKRIRIVKENKTDTTPEITTTEIKYAEGNSRSFRYNWSDRKDLLYLYSSDK